MAKKKPRRKMSQLAFIISLSLAVVFDLMGYMLIPFVGGIFNWTLTGIYTIEGYNGSFLKKLGAKGVVKWIIKWLSTIIESVPVLGNFVPGCIIFVLVSFALNRSAYKARVIEEKLEQNRQMKVYADSVKQLQRYQERYQGGLIP